MPYLVIVNYIKHQHHVKDMSKLMKIGMLDDFSIGEGKIIEIENRKLAVFRAGDAVYAIDNTCPHEETSLGDGMFEDGKVTCPGHGWVFDVRTGEREYIPSIKVQTYKTTINENKDIFVEIQ